MPDSIVSLNEESLRADLRELVRRTVEEMPNVLLDEEADDLVGAERYERTADREAYRAGHYERKLATTSGEVAIRTPKLKGMRFATAVIERYRRRETSVEEAMMEMHLAGASTRRIEDVSEILRGSSVSAATVPNLNERAFEAVEARRSRPLERAHPHVYADGIHLKRSWGGSCENAAAMVAIGVNDDGYREVIGAAEGFAESSECRREFLSRLRSRGLRGVRMLTGGTAAGMAGSIAEVFPEAAMVVRDGYAETLTCTRFPRGHWRRIRTNNAIERLNREIRRRTRVVGTFPDGRSALMLVAARLKYVAESSWGSRRYLDVTLLDEQPYRKAGQLGCRKVRKNLDGTYGRRSTLRLVVTGGAGFVGSSFCHWIC